jgi:hypothetical protein
VGLLCDCRLAAKAAGALKDLKPKSKTRSPTRNPKQVLSADEARMHACQAIFAYGEAFGSGMSNHSDGGGKGGEGGDPTLLFGRDMPLEHASLFRFEMTDWRWDARTRHAAWEHGQVRGYYY